MIDNYQDLLAQCADAAETAATAVLYSALEGCSDEVLQDLLEEVQDGYTFEDSYSEPPPLNRSTAMFRKRRTMNGKQTTKARRDRYKVASS